MDSSLTRSTMEQLLLNMTSSELFEPIGDETAAFILPQFGDLNGLPTQVGSAAPSNIVMHRGRWTADEKLLFLYGLKKFGKGKWKKISPLLPRRTLVQIKSHAQKVLKRQQAGESIFKRLKECSARLQVLLQHANLPDHHYLQAHTIVGSSSCTPTSPKKEGGGGEHIIAASALVSLGAPGSESNSVADEAPPVEL